VTTTHMLLLRPSLGGGSGSLASGPHHQERIMAGCRCNDWWNSPVPYVEDEHDA